MYKKQFTLSNNYVFINNADTTFHLYDTDKNKIASVRRYTDKKLVVHHNDIYDINFECKTIGDDLHILLRCIHTQIPDVIPYYHLYQPLDLQYIESLIFEKTTNMDWIQDSFNAIPAYIPLHEFKAKIDIMKMHIQTQKNLMEVYKKYVSQLPYIVWSIEFKDVSKIDMKETQTQCILNTFHVDEY